MTAKRAHWENLRWGDIATLEYGKSLRDYENSLGAVRVFGTNGPIGWTDQALSGGATVVVGRKGAYRGVHFSPNPCFVIDTAFYLKPKVEIDVRWAYFQLLTADINRLDSGSAIPSTSREDFYAIPVAFPPVEEQRRIAAVLGSLDDRIELNRKTNETLEAMARALFKSWFVDFDPVRAKAAGRKPQGPPFAPGLNLDSTMLAKAATDPAFQLLPMDAAVAAAFPDSFEVDDVLADVPKGWEVRALYDCAIYTNGSAFRNEDFSEGKRGLPIIKIGELKDGITDQTKFTEREFEGKYRITAGDILFSWSGSPDTSIDTFLWTGRDGWLNQHIFKMQFNRAEERAFIFGLLRHFKPVFIEIARDKQTTGLGHVTAKDLQRLKTVFPPKPVLQGFNRVVEPLLARLYENLRQSQTLATIRDVLLPKLLSGEVTVPAAASLVKGQT